MPTGPLPLPQTIESVTGAAKARPYVWGALAGPKPKRPPASTFWQGRVAHLGPSANPTPATVLDGAQRPYVLAVQTGQPWEADWLTLVPENRAGLAPNALGEVEPTEVDGRLPLATRRCLGASGAPMVAPQPRDWLDLALAVLVADALVTALGTYADAMQAREAAPYRLEAQQVAAYRDRLVPLLEPTSAPWWPVMRDAIEANVLSAPTPKARAARLRETVAT